MRVSYVFRTVDADWVNPTKRLVREEARSGKRARTSALDSGKRRKKG